MINNVRLVLIPGAIPYGSHTSDNHPFHCPTTENRYACLPGYSGLSLIIRGFGFILDGFMLRMVLVRNVKNGQTPDPGRLIL